MGNQLSHLRGTFTTIQSVLRVLQGDRYYFGLGVQMNFSKAMKLYVISANQGYALAQYRLGIVMRMDKVFQKIFPKQFTFTLFLQIKDIHLHNAILEFVMRMEKVFRSSNGVLHPFRKPRTFRCTRLQDQIEKSVCELVFNAVLITSRPLKVIHKHHPTWVITDRRFQMRNPNSKVL